MNEWESSILTFFLPFFALVHYANLNVIRFLEILKKRKKKKGGRIFELMERIIVLIFAILFFVEKFGI